MIELDNIIFSLQKAGGISVVWKNLIENISKESEDVYFIEYPGAQDNLFRKEIEIDSSKLDTKNKFHTILTQLKHPRIEANKPFIFHSSYFRTCKNPKAINVTTVHDFIYEQSNPTLKQKFRIALNYRAIRNSDAIVCISENTKRDLFSFLPDIAQNKVHVIYNGVSEDYFPLDEIPYKKYGDYVLFVGGRQGYKNFEFVVKALVSTDFKLLVCGKPLSESEQKLLYENLPDRFEEVQFPSSEELNKIYNSVHALAYPSSYEGFGLPVLEAQRAGCPVIALNASSIPEIIGENALLMLDLSECCFHEMLKKAGDSEQRQLIVRAGLENSARFSWVKMAQQYLELYNKLLSK